MTNQNSCIIDTTISDSIHTSSKIENVKNRILQIINTSDITIEEYEYLLSYLNNYKNIAKLSYPIENNI